MSRHVFDSERPFASVLDGIFGGISQDTVEGIVAEMLKRHGDRDNPYTLWLSARRVVGNRS